MIEIFTEVDNSGLYDVFDKLKGKRVKITYEEDEHDDFEVNKEEGTIVLTDSSGNKRKMDINVFVDLVRNKQATFLIND